MQNKTFRFTGVLINTLEKVLKLKINVEGLENVVDNPTLFVVNHFTRMETFLIPYVLYKHKKMIIRSLASASLLNGIFGEYLKNMGTLSTREPQRNRHIIRGLLTGLENWMIYPEGIMVKNKQVFEKGKYRLNTPEGHHPIHTGAAILSLKTEIARKEYLWALTQGNNEMAEHYMERYTLTGPDEVSPLSTMVIPVNITYYPLRPGKNLLSDLAGLFFKDLPSRVDEELKTEGRLLFSDSEITIYFGKAIPVDDYVQTPLHLLHKMAPYTKHTTREQIVLGLQKTRLTQKFSEQIYTKVGINIDHLFCMGLRQLKSNCIKEETFCRALYITALQIREMEQRRTHSTLKDDFIKCITDEEYKPLHDICSLAEQEKAITRNNGTVHIDHSRLKGDDFPFHDIRLKNIATVLANEIAPLKKVVKQLHTNVNLPDDILRKMLAKALHEKDVKSFEREYLHYYDEELSKPASVGRPFFMKSSYGSRGIILAHGYLAAPEEMRQLAAFLYGKGYSVYVARLAGMGTTPQHLAETKWPRWVHSFNRAYGVIKNYCDSVIVGGFSAGALLALIAAARKKNDIRAVISINAPIVLQDTKSKLVPSRITWNHMLEHMHIDKGKLEYIENESESPDINYSRNYLTSIHELEKLMSCCRAELSNINCPALIIQGSNDPVVKPVSADIIYDHISSKDKEKVVMDFDRHIIVRNKGSEEVFNRINRFLDERNHD